MVIGHEGGFASTIVELMANDKIKFQTEVPEQLVVLDPDQADQVDDNFPRLIRRYEELLSYSSIPGVQMVFEE